MIVPQKVILNTWYLCNLKFTWLGNADLGELVSELRVPRASYVYALLPGGKAFEIVGDRL